MTSQTEFVPLGATSWSFDVNIAQNAAGSSPGGPFTTLTNSSSGLVCNYRKCPAGTVTPISLASQTVGGAWVSGGFIVIDAANMPGTYRLDIPNVVGSTRGKVEVVLAGVTNMQPHFINIFVGVDMTDAVHMGLTALPNVASGAAGALITAGTGVAQLNVTAGIADANAASVGGLVYIKGVATNGGNNSITLQAGTTVNQAQVGFAVLLGTGPASYQFGIIDSFDINTLIAILGPTTGPSPFQWPLINPTAGTPYVIIPAPGGQPASIFDFWQQVNTGDRILSNPTNITSTGQTIPLSGTPVRVTTDAGFLIGTPVSGTVTGDITAVQTKLGTPVLSTMSLDIAAVETKLGTPAGASVSADVLTANTGIAALNTNYTASRAAKLDNLDVAVSTRVAPTVAGRTLAVNATGQAGLDWANISGPTTAVNLSGTTINTATAIATLIGAPVTSVSGDIAAVQTKLGAPATASVSGDIAAVKLETDKIGTPVLATIALDIAAVQTKLGAPATASVSGDIAAVQTKLGSPVHTTVSGDIANVQADTSTLTTRLTSQRAGNLDNIGGGAVALGSDLVSDTSTILSNISNLSTKIGTPAVTVSADIAAVKGVLPTALVGGLMNSVVGALGAGSISAATFATGAINNNALDSSAATEIAVAVKNTVVEVNGARTMGQAMSIILAATAGVSTGGGTSFKDPSGTDVRIVGSVDSNGNRLTINLSPSA